MVVQSCLATVRPLVKFLAWVLSCGSNKGPRHMKRAVATTPSRVKTSSAATALCSDPALSITKGQVTSPCSGQVLKDGAPRLGVGSIMRKKQGPTVQTTCRGHSRPGASEGKANEGREQGA